jgi:hypothetical protein
MSEWRRGIRDHGLSIAFFSLFLVALAAQAACGRAAYNGQLAAHHLPPVSRLEYLQTGDFLEGVFSNWQAAILQIGCLVLFSKFLRERGAPHSRKSDGEAERQDPGHRRKRAQDRDARASWVYKNSLSLLFAGLFAVVFVGHALAAGAADGSERRLLGLRPLPLFADLGSSRFWFKTTQTWQAEFFAIGVFVVASVRLRQQGSAESKPVASSDRETGEPNA